MAHVLIVGLTGSGKTTLALALSSRISRAGFQVLVLDPIGDRRWLQHTPHVFRDPRVFLAVAEDSRRCLLVVDESGEMIGHYDEEMKRCATRYRHLGHRSVFICPRAAEVSPSVRAQCTSLFAFRGSTDDARVLARQFGAPELEQMQTLERGEFIEWHAFGPCRRGRVKLPTPKSVGEG